MRPIPLRPNIWMHLWSERRATIQSLPGIVLGLLLLLASGCGGNLPSQAQTERGEPGSEEEAVPVVDVRQAEVGTLAGVVTYAGTTAPVQEVSLRSQTEGQLLALSVDAGDFIQAGSPLARIDAALLQTAVSEAEAELAARQFLVAQAEAEVADAQAQVEQARASYEQAEADAERFQSLSSEGAAPEQQAEQAVTAMRTAEQSVRSAQEQVRTRQQAIAAAGRRVASQQAILDQTRERLSFATVNAPLTGVVLQRLAEPGDLIQSGQELLKVGDMSQVHVNVQVSDRDRAQLRIGQPADVQIDALPQQTFSGRITRISPVADETARLIPIEITLANPNGLISSGLLARVNFAASGRSAVVIPTGAMDLFAANNSEGDDATGAKTTEAASEATVFVISGTGDDATVEPRRVQLGARANDQVEVVSGLRAGDRYVVRSSSGALQPGQAVRLSLLSDGE
ncbi:MAG: efflux RND transporter periplasmic adaptor subunit [Elainellaceae cyanobacterium]